MKKLLLMMLVVLMGMEGTCLAMTIGPATPLGKQGDFTLSAGAYFASLDLEGNVEASQRLGFLQGDFAFTDNCGFYLQAGTADLDAKNVFGGSGRFESDNQLFGTAGLRGKLKDFGAATLGAFAQGTWFDDFEDSATVGSTQTTVTFEGNYQYLAGLVVQGELEGAILYGGPFGYARKGDVTIAVPGSSAKASYEEDGNLGGFLGIRWPLQNGVTFELESQLRTRVSVGGTVSFTF